MVSNTQRQMDAYKYGWMDVTNCKIISIYKHKHKHTHTHTHKFSKHKDRWMHAGIDQNMQTMEKIFVILWIKTHTHRIGMFPWF